MANRKQLKKSVKMITGDLFADCVALSMCQQADRDTLDQWRICNSHQSH